MSIPMVLHFYNQDSEVEKTYTRTFVPWKILKEAAKLSTIDQKNISDQDVEAITNLMVTVFGGQFTAEDAETKADMQEMIAVLMQVMNAAKGGLKQNPTPPAK